MRARRFDPHRFFYLVKLYAIEVAATIIFLSWLVGGVWHEPGETKKPTVGRAQRIVRDMCRGGAFMLTAALGAYWHQLSGWRLVLLIVAILTCVDWGWSE
jgi:hypothetical protein